jgi:hypothetical protein
MHKFQRDIIQQGNPEHFMPGEESPCQTFLWNNTDVEGHGVTMSDVIYVEINK